MSEIIGIVLIVAGLILILLGVLVWLGVLKPSQQGEPVPKSTSIVDLLIALFDKAPWVVAVGLVLILIGVILLGVDLPF